MNECTQMRYEWDLRQRQQGQGGDSSMRIKYVVKEKGQQQQPQQPQQQQQQQQHQHGDEAAQEREQVVVPLESKQQVLGADGAGLGPEQ